MKENKKYWKGLEELNNEPGFLERANSEFPEYLPMSETREASDAEDTGRRDFLKLMGFSVAAVSLAACQAPVKHVVPYVNKPEDVDPGVANHYATTYSLNGSYASLLVKTREGRPILVEGNKLSPISQGGVNSEISASILSLYDNFRLQGFTEGGKAVSQETADQKILAKLQVIKAQGGQIRIVSQTVMSPSTKAAIAEFVKEYPTAKHVVYDASSSYGIQKANGGLFPDYDFSNADTIVSIGADFLENWGSSIEYNKQYSKTRKLRQGKDKKNTMSRHYQFESNLSLTGSNADIRKPIKPSEEGRYALALYNAVASLLGQSSAADVQVAHVETVNKAAKDLVASKGKSLVVAGSNDEAVQVIVKELNNLLGAQGSTVKGSTYLKQGNDAQMKRFVEELNGGQLSAVFFYNANPVYDYPTDIKDAIGKLDLSVSFNLTADETGKLTQFACPDNHYLESWGDAEPKPGSYSLQQPTITPIFKTRSAQESLLKWTGSATTDYYAFVKQYWEANVFPKSGSLVFGTFWNTILHDGFYEVSGVAPVEPVDEEVVETPVVPVADAAVGEEDTDVEADEEVVVATPVAGLGDAVNAVLSKKGGEYELLLVPSYALNTGAQANNPWLQELPDPISKVCWDNYISVSQADAAKLGVVHDSSTLTTNLATVTYNGVTLKLPVLVQPGQASGAATIALGYGRTDAGRLGKTVHHKNPMGQAAIGVDVFPLIDASKDTLSYSVSGVVIKATGEKYQLAQTQTSQTVVGRDNESGLGIIQEGALADYANDNKRGDIVWRPKLHSSEGVVDAKELDLWVDAPKGEEPITHKYNNHHWGLVVDMNACTGCSACVISCHAENNVPVVGKKEVINRRDMHWLRIDRYYSTAATREKEGFNAMEIPEENPEVVFQPMMCQHCNHAPCETVCPVAATTHSSEGLNQMTYNRCIGTRYCANNCPFKVRRFNWFNYADNGDPEFREIRAVNTSMNDDLGKMVLNPDVTVRARGVMEKCSMCVQRIQAGKLEAKMEGRKVKDGDVDVACASVCSSDALLFGDMNDKNSAISKALNEDNADRAYHVLEELNVKPNVSYLAKIRNK
ncbi:MAG: TAT-variant-translocated molybdopterin oxidoreductase [Cytophagales bacterium]|nr:TAT-variant-translocated molybdopterin oxidoreductase [Cytophagales bacterium]